MQTLWGAVQIYALQSCAVLSCAVLSCAERCAAVLPGELAVQVNSEAGYLETVRSCGADES
jgi:hypothetical protein